MSRAEVNWERLVRAALRGERFAGVYGQPVTGIAGNVPSSLGNNVHIEEVLRAADEIQDEDPTVARIRKFCKPFLFIGARPLFTSGCNTLLRSPSRFWHNSYNFPALQACYTCMPSSLDSLIKLTVVY